MKKTILILLIILLFCSGCSLKSLNFLNTKNYDYDSVTENLEDDEDVNAGATFLVDGKEIFLTWEELQKPENGELYDYDASDITNEEIRRYAFYANEYLTSITIPDTVTSIGKDNFVLHSNALYACLNLFSISVDPNNPEYASIDGVLFSKDLTELINYPCAKAGSSYTIPDSVTSIGCAAFSDCSNLTSVNLPNSITSIGVGAFADCSSLTSITIPNSVTEIKEHTFNGCSSLVSITIPDSITSIYDFAFQDCSSLTSVTIPDSVTGIWYKAFDGCSALASVNIPDSVTYFDRYAFSWCTNLTVTINEDNDYLKSFCKTYMKCVFEVQNTN